MLSQFDFDAPVYKTLIGGLSAIDLPRLNVLSLEEATLFIKAYGFDIDTDSEKLWYFHRRAAVFLNEKLGYDLAQIPDEVKDRKELQDLRRLLLWASSLQPEEKNLQRWSCAFLRIIHVFIHSESDLFSFYSEEIQKQILSPIQDCIVHDGTTGSTFLKRPNGDEPGIPLVRFESKPFKTSASTVIKLLAKPDALAMNIYDKLGVRFVTQTVFDAFRVVQFLLEQHLVSFPHVLPEQSSNNLYPVDLFLEVCREVNSAGLKLSPEDVNIRMIEKMQSAQENSKLNLLRKENSFSGAKHKFIKFISRRMILTKSEKKEQGIQFFYPFEVQVMDEASYLEVMQGPSDHQSYKERQIQAARSRLLPDGL